VAALAIDPFSQQILQYDGCSTVVADISARIPRNNNFTADTVGPIWSDVLDEKMAGAIWLGVLQPPQNVSSQVNIQCPSGNCTFPADAGAAYETIAICSSCEDISSKIVNLPEPHGPIDITVYYTLPASSEGANDSLTIGRSIALESRVVDTSDLFAFESIMFSQEDVSGIREVRTDFHMKAFATHCSLIPCVQSYTATIKEFKLDEQVISSTNMVYNSVTSTGKTLQRETIETFLLVPNSTVRDGIQHECVKTEHRTPENTIELGHLNKIPQWTSPMCFFQYDSSSQATSEYLGRMFRKKGLVIGRQENETIGDLWMQRLYQRGTANVTTAREYMSGLAISMSAHMRKELDVSQDALGIIHAQQTCVRINWVWISLPASLVLLGMLFFAATMWSTLTQTWHGMWKSSALALVFVSIESEKLLHDEVLDKNSQIANAAQNMKAKFMKTERGWDFVQH
jgi:hypothetical protein